MSSQALTLKKNFLSLGVLRDDREESHPDSALGVLGRALVHETRMLENGTFSEEKEFTAAAEASASMLEKALDEP